VRRSWHVVHEINLQDGGCPACGHKIPLIESDPSQRRSWSMPLYEVLA
jgi:hypothetical protein